MTGLAKVCRIGFFAVMVGTTEVWLIRYFDVYRIDGGLTYWSSGWASGPAEVWLIGRFAGVAGLVEVLRLLGENGILEE